MNPADLVLKTPPASLCLCLFVSVVYTLRKMGAIRCGGDKWGRSGLQGPRAFFFPLRMFKTPTVPPFLTSLSTSLVLLLTLFRAGTFLIEISSRFFLHSQFYSFGVFFTFFHVKISGWGASPRRLMILFSFVSKMEKRIADFFDASLPDCLEKRPLLCA